MGNGHMENGKMHVDGNGEPSLVNGGRQYMQRGRKARAKIRRMHV
jgi:hypothetical protein